MMKRHWPSKFGPATGIHLRNPGNFKQGRRHKKAGPGSPGPACWNGILRSLAARQPENAASLLDATQYQHLNPAVFCPALFCRIGSNRLAFTGTSSHDLATIHAGIDQVLTDCS